VNDWDSNDLYVCPECHNAVRLSFRYISEIADALECFCLSSQYERWTTTMINVEDAVRKEIERKEIERK
jgi:hypothetical protein